MSIEFELTPARQSSQYEQIWSNLFTPSSIVEAVNIRVISYYAGP